MKSLTVRLPNALVAEIELESQRRGISKSDVVRERLKAAQFPSREHPLSDIFAEIDRLPSPAGQRNAARDKKRLPEIIRASKRHN